MTSSRTSIWIIAVVLWTVLIGAIAWKSIIVSQKTIKDLAEVQARASFSDVLTHQKWTARHGGIYIPLTEETPATPFLAHMPDREIVTPAGKTLTLVNHTYINRQVHESASPANTIKERVTSLNPTRAENNPDAWEKKSLTKIQTRDQVVKDISYLDGRRHLRMMFPLHLDENCLQCHNNQGFTAGDQYGGISISVPFAPFQTAIQSTATNILMMLLFVWTLGLFLILFVRRIVKNQFKIIEETLIESKTLEIKYRTLFDQAAGGICVSDMDTGKIIDCNHSMAELVGRTRDELIGETQSILFPAAEQNNPDDEIKKIWRDKNDQTPSILEKKLINKDGQLIDVQIKAAPLVIEGRKLLQGFFYDTTVQKRLHAQAIRSSQLASVGELSAGVAHEINNPIGGVINYAQILLNQESNNDFEKELLTKIIKEGKRIAKIVKSLLSLSRKSEKKQFVYDFKKIIMEPLELVNAHIVRDGIIVSVDIHKDLPIIECNPQQIEQLVLNLITNAKYALNEKYPAANINKKIEISVTQTVFRQQKCLQMVFLDYGTGIKADNLPRIKNAFCTTKPTGEGTGLGLSICEEIVTNHNGQLEIESKYGDFTKITIYLPIESNIEH